MNYRALPAYARGHVQSVSFMLVFAGNPGKLMFIGHFAMAFGASKYAPLDFVHYPWSHSLAALLFWIDRNRTVKRAGTSRNTPTPLERGRLNKSV